MPVEKLTPSQAEAIRQDGICRETGVVAQWGYHPKAEPKIFYLKDGEALPKGWSAAPVAAEAVEAPKAE